VPFIALLLMFSSDS